MLKSSNIPEHFDAENTPALTLKKRSDTKSVSDLQKAVSGMTGFSDERRMVILGLLFLWHDHWTEAHKVTDDYEGTPDSDLLHAMVHRREGDYGNSEYWLRSAGNHPLFEILGSRVEPLLLDDENLRRKILPNGKWDAKGFVRAIKEQPNHSLLKEIQAEEFRCFYEYLVG